jgi:hypothetical protein
MWKLSPVDVLKIPWSLRKRMIEQKVNLENRREADMKRKSPSSSPRRRAR